MGTMLRSRKNLCCFYCGRRSDVQFSGQPSFECRHCEATNWLDEKGAITDPPATTATSDEASHLPAANRFSTSFSARHDATEDFVVRASSPLGVLPNGSIFCAKCQRNQELLERTLKEYEFPDDPSDPEYAVRAKGYRIWKRDLETRYPQVCAECEPKVEEQLRKASYTAKTDHMRRMIDRTKERRHQARRRTLLDYIDLAGKWTWHVAFLLQTIWHTVVLGTLLLEQNRQGVLDNQVLASLSKSCVILLNALPPADRIIKWAINMGLLAFVWNPRFKQTIRGFTSHILGFRQWYTYQLVIVLIRCSCLFLSQYNEAQGIPATTQLGAHLVISWLMFYVYQVAGKAIRTDNTPLFGSRQPPRLSPDTDTTPRQAIASQPTMRSNDLGGILDEIMESSSKGDTSSPIVPQSLTSTYRSTKTRRSNVQNRSFRTPARQGREPTGMNALSFSDSPSSPHDGQTQQHSDEMDWSPSGSQHRAFSTHNPFKVRNPNPRFTDSPLGFNDTPIEPKSGPFWYKVPPAPTNPAQRLRNPVKPVIRESPKEMPETFFSRPRAALDMDTKSQGNDSSFTLRDPQFYAPAPRDDPRDGLSNMMGSFSISPDPDDRRATSTMGPNGRTFANNQSSVMVQNHNKIRMAELLVLFGALWAWVTAVGTEDTYGPTLGLGAICACLIVSLRLTADLLVEAQVTTGKYPPIFSLSWANLGYAQAIGALVLVWNIWAVPSPTITCGVYGNALLGVMVVHQFWHVFS